MALVAYESSSNSEEESDSDEDNTTPNINKEVHNIFPKTNSSQNNSNNLRETDVKDHRSSISFATLPTPKLILNSKNIVEEDDEFLQKKAMPSQVEKFTPKKGRVKITIPSLNEFADTDNSNSKNSKVNIGPIPKSGSLLNMLPKPKHEKMYLGGSLSNAVNVKTSLIPDSIKNKPPNLKTHTVHKVENTFSATFEEENEDSGSDDDFFSLNSKQELPEVSINEINSMVAKKVARMAEAAVKFEEQPNSDMDKNDILQETEKSSLNEEVRFDEKALHVLVGSSAKRKKVEVNVVELSTEQVLPNKDEWLRSALAQATTYQPKGVLVDEEPAPGTRKKHQITYLAHQAKANEQELQAMWAANRHTRRQTQSKYGF